MPAITHDDILTVENSHHQHAVGEVLRERIQVEIDCYTQGAAALGLQRLTDEVRDLDLQLLGLLQHSVEAIRIFGHLPHVGIGPVASLAPDLIFRPGHVRFILETPLNDDRLFAGHYQQLVGLVIKQAGHLRVREDFRHLRPADVDRSLVNVFSHTLEYAVDFLASITATVQDVLARLLVVACELCKQRNGAVGLDHIHEIVALLVLWLRC